MAPDEPKVNHEPPRGLPTVQPPSGRHIVQLFVVPGLIVTVAVLLLLGFSWLVSGENTADQLLKRLQDPNPDVRWRAANDLAQRLKRDDQMAADPKVALELTALLQQAQANYERATSDLAERSSRLSKEDLNRESEQLKQKRKDIQFLSPCVGTLILPTGAPLLVEIALQEKGPDDKSVALVRRQAVWALANLGENLRRFDKLPADRKEAILRELEARAAAESGQRQLWASQTLDSLRGTRPLGVIEGLATAANASDPFLRKLTALALTFWAGTPEENQLAELTLVRLSRDDGRGVSLEIGENN